VHRPGEVCEWHFRVRNSHRSRPSASGHTLNGAKPSSHTAGTRTSSTKASCPSKLSKGGTRGS
jgi:hypothetical protein